MREIKFRAYDYDTNKMYHDINITFTTWGKILIQLDFGDKDLDVYLPNAVALQYTGLKDRNDKEIYEDDIVKVSGTTNGLGEHVDFNIVCIRDLIQDYHKLVCTSCWDGTCVISYLKVIGNIRENPELY